MTRTDRQRHRDTATVSRGARSRATSWWRAISIDVTIGVSERSRTWHGVSRIAACDRDRARHRCIPQVLSNNEIFDDLLDKHPVVKGKIGPRAHATKGLIKPYWARRLKNRDVCMGRRPSARARPLPCPTTLVTVRHFTPLATRSGARAVCLGQRSDNLTWVDGASGVRPTWVRVLRVSRTLRAHPNPRTQVASRTHAHCPPPPPPTGRAPSQDPGTRRRDSHHHFPTTRYA